METKNAVTFRSLSKLEPGLRDLSRAITAAHSDGLCAWDFYFSDVRPKLGQCVGYDARHQGLKTAEAWDAADNFLIGKVKRVHRPCRCCGGGHE